jgi:hypothetical protein
MKTSLLSLFAGTVFLAGAAGASAGEPAPLASAELDAITAGQVTNTITATGFIAQSNSADVDVSQTATATASGNYSHNYASASNYSRVDIDQSNSNSGNVSVTASIY